ncbi:hypothetical protein E9993_07625 [Labilibacter sediminis]|nr:hypothetical protein E9993_07625 [Labilibacter sediminis]
MKKIATSLLLLALIAVGCGGKKEKTEQSENTPVENTEVKTTEEVSTIDSVITQLEASKSEIEESAKKLDNLLKDIQ